MKWTEIKIITSHEAADALSDFLLSLGAGGIEIYDPDDIEQIRKDLKEWIYIDDSILENKDGVVIKAYFPEGSDITGIKDDLSDKINEASKFLNFGAARITSTVLDEEDWADSWKKYYKPFRITEKIIIKPTWEEFDKSSSEKIVIEMDPGMAFGTGTHETTVMCAGLIEKYIRQGDKMLDIGCGSGILSIIAAKLGAKMVYAIDIDDVAVKVTQENAVRNHTDAIIKCFTGELKDVSHTEMDIIAANITAGPIIDISEILEYYLKSDGIFIASGIIKDRTDEVLDVYLKKGYTEIEKIRMGEWVAIAFRWAGSM